MLPALVPQPSSVAANARSVYGGARTTINFLNHLEFEPAKVSWIDFDGNRVLYAAVAPGDSRSQATHVGHPWEVVVSRRDESISITYFPIASESNAILDKSLFPIRTLLAIKPSEAPNILSASGGEPTAIEFDNRLQIAIKVYWIDFYGKNISFAKVLPGRTSRQVTFVGHPWLVAAHDERSPLAIFFPAPYEGTAIIDSSLLGEEDFGGAGSN